MCYSRSNSGMERMPSCSSNQQSKRCRHEAQAITTRFKLDHDVVPVTSQPRGIFKKNRFIQLSMSICLQIGKVRDSNAKSKVLDTTNKYFYILVLESDYIP